MSKTNSKNSKSSKSGACCVYDFTLPESICDINTLNERLIKICKKYTFQLEEGKSGYRHYQGRVSLKQKMRLGQVIKLFDIKECHISVTSKQNRDNTFYVMKEDTRISGPYTESNYIEVPIDVKDMITLYPWQETLIKELSVRNDRIVDIIIDKEGNNGKTSWSRYMNIKLDGQILPFANDHKEIMRMAYDVGVKRTYIIDMPRSLKKDKLASLYAGIEMLKSGYCYDDRYNFKQRFFDPPRVVVFTNEEPKYKYLSMDRWKIWTIKNKKLIKFMKGNCHCEKEEDMIGIGSYEMSVSNDN